MVIQHFHCVSLSGLLHSSGFIFRIKERPSCFLTVEDKKKKSVWKSKISNGRERARITVNHSVCF